MSNGQHVVYRIIDISIMFNWCCHWNFICMNEKKKKNEIICDRLFYVYIFYSWLNYLKIYMNIFLLYICIYISFLLMYLIFLFIISFVYLWHYQSKFLFMKSQICFLDGNWMNCFFFFLVKYKKKYVIYYT